MRRVLSRVARVLLFLVGALAALWLAMPWREVGSAALSLASGRAGIAVGGVEGVDGGFTVEGLSTRGVPSVSFRSVTIRPQLWASVLSVAPVCEVEFDGGTITMGQVLSLGAGGALVTAGRSEILFEGLRTDGDLTVRGFLTIDPARMRIGTAEAAVQVPASFEGNMDGLRTILPLVREGDRWYLRRARGGTGR